MKDEFPSQCRSKYSGSSEPADFPAVRDVLLYFLQYRERSCPSTLSSEAYSRRRKLERRRNEPAESKPAGLSKYGSSILVPIIFIFAAFLLCPCITLAETNAPSPADLLWKEAETALGSRQYSNAEKLFNDFIKRNFNDERVSSARIYIGICDSNQNRSQRALDAWNRVVNAELMHKRSSPALLLGLEQLARHYRTQRNMSELEKILDHLLQMFPADPLTVREHTLSARACIESGDYIKAAGLYGKVSDSLKGRDMEDYRLAKELAAPGGSVAAIIASANRQLADNSLNTAVQLYEEALKRNPSADERYEAMTKLGWCLYLRKECKDAFNDLIREYPEKASHPPIQEYLRDCEEGLRGSSRKGR